MSGMLPYITLGRRLQSPHALTQSEWQQAEGEEEGAGQQDHRTGSLSEQPPLWLSVRGTAALWPLQCGGIGRRWCAGCFYKCLLTF